MLDVEDDQGGDDIPIFHGHRLMLRRALKVVLSRLLPRLPIAEPVVGAVERLLQVGELAVLSTAAAV